MKLKRWLILSHLIVILTPILTGVLLYKLIINYNKKVELKDYIIVAGKFKEYESKLEDSKIYLKPQGDMNFVKKEDENKVLIKLYNADGQVIYSSNSDMNYSTSKEILFSDLYKITTGYKAYTLKKPVFYKGDLVGFYQIIMAREEFIENINNRTILTAACFSFVLITVFIIVILLLNRKFNRPMKLLIEGMNSFAKGNKANIIYESKDEIGELIEHFNNMKNDLEEKREIIEQEQKSKEYMISAISHDLKTPLTAIRAYAEAINSDKASSSNSIKDKASVIINKSDYMKKMIDDLMLYTLLTSDYKMDFVEVEGEEFFQMLFSGYDEVCEKSNINLYKEICVDGIYMVDVKQMMRVIDNLVGNSIKYTPCEGHIWLGGFSLNNNFPDWIETEVINEIRLWKSEGCILLVKNDGEPISEEEMSKIFKPFYQVDNSRNKTSNSGVGLGLSIVNLIIGKHGGELKLFSKESSTVFACWVPDKHV